jgi:hypothetical protein
MFVCLGTDYTPGDFENSTIFASNIAHALQLFFLFSPEVLIRRFTLVYLARIPHVESSYLLDREPSTHVELGVRRVFCARELHPIN